MSTYGPPAGPPHHPAGQPQQPGYPPQQPGYPPQQPGYPPQQPAPWSAQPPPWQPAPQPAGPVCRFCGGYPALQGKARGHRGMVLMMQFRNIEGPFCKDCGTAAVRTMSAQTLWQGWWGLASFFVTPITLLTNVFLRSRLSRLGPAVRPVGATPLDAGRPLIQRPALLGLLVPALAVGIVVIAVLSPDTSGGGVVPTTPTTPATFVGQCVRITTKDGQESARRVPCNVDHQGIITAEEQKEEDCPNDTVWVFDRDETRTILCVARA